MKILVILTANGFKLPKKTSFPFFLHWIKYVLWIAENTPNKKPHSMEECKDPKNCPDHMENDMDKKSPCWDGYVQRGMKPGKDGRMVPNCVPAKKYIVDQIRPLF